MTHCSHLLFTMTHCSQLLFTMTHCLHLLFALTSVLFSSSYFCEWPLMKDKGKNIHLTTWCSFNYVHYIFGWGKKDGTKQVIRQLLWYGTKQVIRQLLWQGNLFLIILLIQSSIFKLSVSRHFQQYFSYIVTVSSIGGENQSTWRNPLF